MSMWYVSKKFPDYPQKVDLCKRSGDGEHWLFGWQFEDVADSDEIFDNKTEALEEARRLIRARICTMHNEGMEDHDYGRSRDWAEGLVQRIGWEIEDPECVFDPQELANDLTTFRRESGQW